MKRRAFIAALATAPLFIRRAFADASLREARVAARPTDRPTLVFVVPRGESGRSERGAMFGELLNKAGDRDLAQLALVDVVCARASDFGVSGDPYLLFVVGSTVHRSDPQPRGATAVKWELARFIHENLPTPPASSVTELAQKARARYVKHAPRGARWGNSGACGVSYEEGPPADMVDCGMAFAPEASRRFLDFYVKAS